MGSLPDRRVEKTREALYAALVSEILSKGYDTVTIQGILDKADVGRSTFYGHFSGKEDLLRFGFVHLPLFLHQFLSQRPHFCLLFIGAFPCSGSLSSNRRSGPKTDSFSSRRYDQNTLLLNPLYISEACKVSNPGHFSDP